MLKIPFHVRDFRPDLRGYLFKFFTILSIVTWFVPTGFAQNLPDRAPDELLVGLRGGVSDARAEQIYRSLGAQPIEILDKIQVHRIRVNPAAIDAVEKALLHRSEIKFVEKNLLVSPDFIPNDPLYSAAWHLQKVSMGLAWQISMGTESIIIAILDSGIDGTHPDLASKLVPGYNFYDGNIDTSDAFGHGTMVAGAAAAICDNGIGVASPACKNLIMPVRVSKPSGSAYYSTIAQGLTYAVDHGAKVMNISFGGVAASSTITSAAQYVNRHGGIVVAAAGNCGCFDSTADNPYLISVSATDGSDNLASWSSQGNYVDVAAPGVSIYTTTNGGGYSAVSGTSFSSPITAGIVALMMSANPSLKPAQIESLLESTADDLGPTGYDTAYGYGRVNAYSAVAAGATNSPPPDTTVPVASITSPGNGATVSGGVSVSVSATDNVGVTRVDLYVDGSFFASDATSPYSFFMDTTAVKNGSYNLVAVAFDAAGNAGNSAGVTINVDNNQVADTQPPSVSIVAPVSTGRGKGEGNNKLNVSVSASDNVGVADVELWLDGSLVDTSAAAPYDFTINIAKLSGGSHVLQAKAYDPSGNMGLSNPLSFTK